MERKLVNVLLSEVNELKQQKRELFQISKIDAREEYFKTLRWKLTRPGAEEKRRQKALEKRFEKSLNRLADKWKHK